MDIKQSSLISEIVAHDYKTAAVFRRYKIDFCCNGKRTLEEVCNSKNISFDKILNDLEASLHAAHQDIDFQSWDIDRLSDYIYENHHTYVREKYLEINPYLEKICQVHGAAHPELFKIKALFIGGMTDLLEHMEKEEQILFPYFKELVEAEKNKSTAQLSKIGWVQSPIACMHDEHNQEGERFRKIAQLSNDYTPPAGACNTYMVTFKLLEEFEKDLHRHIHLENNILFQKAIELEEQLR